MRRMAGYAIGFAMHADRVCGCLRLLVTLHASRSRIGAPLRHALRRSINVFGIDRRLGAEAMALQTTRQRYRVARLRLPMHKFSMVLVASCAHRRSGLTEVSIVTALAGDFCVAQMGEMANALAN